MTNAETKMDIVSILVLLICNYFLSGSMAIGVVTTEKQIVEEKYYSKVAKL